MWVLKKGGKSYDYPYVVQIKGGLSREVRLIKVIFKSNSSWKMSTNLILKHVKQNELQVTALSGNFLRSTYTASF